MIRIQLPVLVIAAAVTLRGQVLTVCDVLARSSTLDGKPVVVRGVVNWGDAVRSLWAAEPCEKPTIRDHWEFVDAIEFDVGGPERSAYHRVYGQARAEHPGTAVLATLEGILKAPGHFEIRPDSLGFNLPRAFAFGLAAKLSCTRMSGFRTARPRELTQEESERRRHPEPRWVR